MQADEKANSPTAQAFSIYISFTPLVSGKSLPHAGCQARCWGSENELWSYCREVMNVASGGRWAWV